MSVPDSHEQAMREGKNAGLHFDPDTREWYPVKKKKKAIAKKMPSKEWYTPNSLIGKLDKALKESEYARKHPFDFKKTLGTPTRKGGVKGVPHEPDDRFDPSSWEFREEKK